MVNNKKINRIVMVLTGIVSFLILLFIFQTVRGLLTPASWNTASISMVAVGTMIISASLAIALKLLLSIKKEKTPFNLKNVKRLKAIAVLLMTLEPYQYIATYVVNKLNPLFLDDGIKVTVRTSWGGCILTAGLVIYCVSLVFEYGISLQNQVDETL